MKNMWIKEYKDDIFHVILILERSAILVFSFMEVGKGSYIWILKRKM